MSGQRLRAICTPDLSVRSGCSWKLCLKEHSCFNSFLYPILLTHPLSPESTYEWLEQSLHRICSEGNWPKPALIPAGSVSSPEISILEVGGRKLVRMCLQLIMVGENEADPQKTAETTPRCCSPSSSCPWGISGSLQGVVEMEGMIQIVIIPFLSFASKKIPTDIVKTKELSNAEDHLCGKRHSYPKFCI